jgi:hypothetical protein
MWDVATEAIDKWLQLQLQITEPVGANLAKPTNFGTRRTPSLGLHAAARRWCLLISDLLRVLPAE